MTNGNIHHKIENGFHFEGKGMDAVAERTGYRTKAQEEILAYLKSTPGVHHTALEIREHFTQSGSAHRPSDRGRAESGETLLFYRRNH